jgi:hypothetical protein
LIEEPKADPSSVRGFFRQIGPDRKQSAFTTPEKRPNKKNKDGSPYGHLSPSLITTGSCFFINYYKRVTFFDVLLGP